LGEPMLVARPAGPAGEDMTASRREHNEVVEQAQRDAETVIARAKAEADEIRQAAYEEGFAEGRQAGYEAGAAAASAEHDRLLAVEIGRLRAIADEAVVDRIEMLQSVETQVVRLAIAVASRIVQREIALDDGVVLRTVRAALRAAADLSTARIRLHPLDRDFLVGFSLPELERDGRRCELVADESVQRGGCIIECASGSVDAQISTQLAEVEAALVG